MKKILLFIMVSLFFIGCSYSIEISLFENRPFYPGFELDKPFFTKPVGSDVVLEDLSIVKEVEDKWDYSNPVWSIALQKGSKPNSKKIKYGEVPKGYSEVVMSGQLEANIKYLAIAFGGGGRGSIEFILNNEGKAIKIK